MPHITAIFGRRWFRKSAGNSHCRAIVALSSGDVLVSPVESGYGDHYIHVGLEHAARNGFALSMPADQVRVGLQVEHYPNFVATVRGVLTHINVRPTTGDVASVQFTSEDGRSCAVGANYCRFFHSSGAAIDSSTAYLRQRGVVCVYADVAREKDL